LEQHPLITTKPVCVTGASGFIASHIVRELLENGYTVRGTVRSLGNGKTYDELKSLPGASERLELVQADLLSEGSFDNAVAGCEYVIHTASPYVIHVKDGQRDLVEPARRGTINVLVACARSESVKKVVLTSSEAAICIVPDPDHVYTEQDWTREASSNWNPYYYSKTVAEQAAWDFMETAKPGFELVVINPGLVIGPSLVPGLNTSHQLFRDMMKGKVPAIVSLDYAIVDVRDVAHAHVLAMENEKASGRYFCFNEVQPLAEIVATLRRGGFSKYRLPKIELKGNIGIALTKIFALVQPKGVRQYIVAQVGRRKNFDNSKIRRELGMHFRNANDTVIEAATDLVKWRHV